MAGAGLLALVAARLVEYLSFPLPRCGFRTLTGIPCPLCGSTHALIAWSHLDVAQAVRMNPLVALAPVALGIWMSLVLLDCKWAFRSERFVLAKPWPAVLIALGIANWIYLIAFPPG